MTAAQMKMFLTPPRGERDWLSSTVISHNAIYLAVCIRISDALERFEEDEMVGIIRFGKEDCVRSGTLPTYAASIQLSVLSVAEPGRTGLCFRCLCPD